MGIIETKIFTAVASNEAAWQNSISEEWDNKYIMKQI